MAQKWEYVTVPLIIHATKQILDNWGSEGWNSFKLSPDQMEMGWSLT